MKKIAFLAEFKIDKDTLALNISTLQTRTATVEIFPIQPFAEFHYAADEYNFNFLNTLPKTPQPHQLLTMMPKGQRSTLCMSVHTLAETRAFNTDNIIQRLLEGHTGSFTLATTMKIAVG